MKKKWTIEDANVFARRADKMRDSYYYYLIKYGQGPTIFSGYRRLWELIEELQKRVRTIHCNQFK